jgi:hypothetical protein
LLGQRFGGTLTKVIKLVGLDCTPFSNPINLNTFSTKQENLGSTEPDLVHFEF